VHRSENMYCKIFRFSDYELRNKMADPKWRMYLKKIKIIVVKVYTVSFSRALIMNLILDLSNSK
jgi:hypothetical protein